MKKDLIVSFLGLNLLLIILACYTPPEVRVSDTTSQERSAEQISERVKQVQNNPSNQITVNDRAVLLQAQDALRDCSATLKVKRDELKTCTDGLAEVTTRYKVLDNESAWYNVFFRDVKSFLWGCLFGAVLIILILIGWKLLKARAGL